VPAPGAEARGLTFPSLMPVFALDRFYLRGLRCRSTMVPRGCAWARMSDHLPLVAELEPDGSTAGARRCRQPRETGHAIPPARLVGGNRVQLLQGGDELFPPWRRHGRARATRSGWPPTSSTTTAPAAPWPTRCSPRPSAAWRCVVVDGFGSPRHADQAARLAGPPRRRLEVFRPLDRWWTWLMPGQLRRLHQKLCVVDREVAFVGGINIIDDRNDLNHGWSEAPRLDFAVAVRGPLVVGRAQPRRRPCGHAPAWATSGATRCGAGAQPAARGRHLRLIRRLRGRRWRSDAGRSAAADGRRLRGARQRAPAACHRAAYVEAIRAARTRVDIAVPYFYPGRAFRRSLRQAARRGVQVRLLLQGKIDYRIAALAARALYDELRAHGVRIHEYTPAFLHAKVAVVDDDWATVGSSNIDPLSLLLNLEANVVVRDADFAQALAQRFDAAVAVSAEVQGRPAKRGLARLLQRGPGGLDGQRLPAPGRHHRDDTTGAPGGLPKRLGPGWAPGVPRTKPLSASSQSTPTTGSSSTSTHQPERSRSCQRLAETATSGQVSSRLTHSSTCPRHRAMSSSARSSSARPSSASTPCARSGAADAPARVQPQPPGRHRVVQQRGVGRGQAQYPAAGSR
jgi:cardiolipin synthase